MTIFNLKRGDTGPTLEVTLLNPDLTQYDPTGGIVKLNIKLSSGIRLVRDMTIVNSKVRYSWIDSDWGPASGGDPATVGGLVVSPLVLTTKIFGHRMEYEVLKDGVRLTFPNTGFVILNIYEDIA